MADSTCVACELPRHDGMCCCALAGDYERLAREIDRLRSEKPKPWRIETDWAVEVLALDGTVVAKFQTRAEAEALIARFEGEGSDAG